MDISGEFRHIGKDESYVSRVSVFVFGALSVDSVYCALGVCFRGEVCKYTRTAKVGGLGSIRSRVAAVLINTRVSIAGGGGVV